LNVTENDTAKAVAPGATIIDFMSMTQTSATITLTNNVPGQDQLSFTNNGTTMGNIAVASNANGVLSLTSAGGTATNAQWQAALRAVTYTNTSDAPTAGLRMVNMTVTDRFGVSNTLTNRINVLAVNDPPVLAVGGNLNFTENGAAAAIDPNLTLLDLDNTTQASATIKLTNYVAGQDSLAFTNSGPTMGNIAVSSNVNGTLTLTSAGATATNAQWQAALRAVTYVNTSDNPTTNPRNVTITVNDGASSSNALASTINLTSSNDAPVLANVGNITFQEGGLPKAIDAGLMLSDVDSATQASATVTLTNFVAGQDALDFINNGTTMGNIAIASNTNGVLTLTSAGATATTAQWQAALRAVTYVNTSDTPTTIPRNVTITVNDGTTSSSVLTGTVNIIASNNSPVLSVGGTLNFTENGAAAAIDSGLMLLDSDNTTQSSATVKITNYVAGQDLLAFTNDGTTMGNIAVATNANGTLTLTSAGGTATNAQWQAALRAVTYVNTSDNPTTNPRNITFTINDGTSNSESLASTVNITAADDLPILTVGGTANFNENGAALPIDSGLTLSDIDSTTQASATVTLTNYIAGQDALAFVNNPATMGNIAIASNANGVLTLTSAGATATNAQWQAALRAVTYVNSSDTPDITARNVTITINDGTGNSNALASTVNVAAVDDLPVLAVDGTLNFVENGTAAAIGTGLTLTDVDNTTQVSAAIKITNYVAGQDTLAFTNDGSTMGNIAVSSNVNGTLTLTSAGGIATNAQWQAALRAVTYVNTSDNPTITARSVTMTVNDGFGNSNVLASTINITATDDLPVLSGIANISFNAGGVAVPIDTGLTLSDVDNTTQSSATVALTNYVAGQDALAFVNNSATMGNIAVASNVNGMLTLTSAGGTATNAQWQAALRAVAYVNTSSTPNLTIRNVAFTVNDGVGNSNALASTININATDVPPTLSVGGLVNFAENGVALPIDTGLLLSDIDSATQVAATIKLTNYVAGQDALGFVNNGVTMGNIAIASNANGTLVLTSSDGSATNAQWQAALRAVTYINTSDTPNVTPRNVTITINDGTSDSIALASTVNITPVNDLPVLGVGGTLNFSENGVATPIDTGLTLADLDSTTQASAKITITNYVAGQDVLAFVNNGTTMGNIAIASNANGVLTLTSVGATATNAQWQAALRAVTYVNTSDNPTVTPRSVTITVNDGTGNSNALASTININATDDLPALAVGGALNFVEGGAAAAIDSGLTLTDVDNTTQASAKITLVNYVAGQDALAFVNNPATMGNIAVALNVNGVLTLTSAGGTATNAQWQAALRAVTYVNTSDTPIVTPRIVTMTVNDGTSDSNVLASTINITATVDLPVITNLEVSPLPYGPLADATSITSTLQLSDANSTTLTGATIKVGNFMSGDQLLFTNTDLIQGSFDAATGVLTLTGTASVADYQAALRSVTYTSTSLDPSTRTISIQVSNGTAVSLAASRQIGGPIQLAGTVLNVYGSANADAISVTQVGGNIIVGRNGVNTSFSTSQVSAINVYGSDGNDLILINSLTSGIGLSLFGGNGNDVLQATALVTANTVMDGGAGDDTILGGSGNNILIGGTGSDVILGGVRNDVIISGSTSLSGNVDAMQAIMAEWNSSDSYQVKINDLLGNTTGGANGSFVLNASTVTNDGAGDTVIGNVGADFFLASSTQDHVLDKALDEVFTQIDSWV
jgi:hypothetical protein